MSIDASPGDQIDACRIEVRGFDLEPLACEPLHSHHEALLFHASAGAVHLATEHSLWLATPGSAVWVPPMWPSGTSNAKNFARITPVHFHGPVPRDLPSRPCAVEIRPFFAALISEFKQAAMGAERSEALRRLILDELGRAPVMDRHLPMPTEPALRRTAAVQSLDMSRPLPVAEAAALAGMSERSFGRHFRIATGLTWARWSSEMRLQAAHRLLEQTSAVIPVAFACGYENPSAFASAFRRRFNISPNEIIKRSQA